MRPVWAPQISLYPFLLSVYFVCLIFSENLGEVFVGQVLRSGIVLLCITSATMLFFFAVFRRINMAAFVAALFLVLAFFHPSVEAALPRELPNRLLITLGIEVSCVAGLIILAHRYVNNWAPINQALNLVVGVMLLLTLYRIGNYGLADRGLIFERTLELNNVEFASFQPATSSRPSIFYILTDAYARSDVLRKYYGYDNSDFVAFLKSKGFQVADNSFGNYNRTELAVSSLMNMEYIADGNGFVEEHPLGFRQLIKDKTFNSKVAAALRSIDYRLVTVRSKGKYVKTGGADDIIFDGGWFTMNDFETALYYTTALPRLFGWKSRKAIMKRLGFQQTDFRAAEGEAAMNAATQSYNRTLVDFVLSETAKLASETGPMFVIAHIMAPHRPFIYDRSGNLPDIPEWKFSEVANVSENVKGYADQVHYLNILLTELIETILEKSEIPPIIVLQGDHGLRLTQDRNRLNPDQQQQLDGMCQIEIFSDLNAMYLPGLEDSGGFYNDISPINTFRLIFDNYFGTELGVIQDRSFLATVNKKSAEMTFIETTDTRDSCNNFWEEKFFGAQDKRLRGPE
jgi:hypothetical protein